MAASLGKTFLFLVLPDTWRAGAPSELSCLAWMAERGGGCCGGTCCQSPSIMLLLTTLLKICGELDLQQHTSHGFLPVLLQLTLLLWTSQTTHKDSSTHGSCLLFQWIQTQWGGQQEAIRGILCQLSPPHTPPRSTLAPSVLVLCVIHSRFYDHHLHRTSLMSNKMRRNPSAAEPSSSVAALWKEL